MRKLNDWLESYLQFTSHSEAPLNFNRWAGLWMLSTVIERKALMDFGRFQIYPNLFVVLVGPPAARKGTAAGMAKALLKEVDGPIMGPDIASIQSLIHTIGTNEKEFDFRGETRTHCSVSLLSTEWSTFLGDKDRYLCNVMCKLYDCDSEVKKETKTQGNDYLTNVYLTMLACSTARQISDCLPHAAIGGGFTSRCIFVVEDQSPKKIAIPEFTLADQQLKLDLINDLEHIHKKIKGEFKFTSGGRKYFTDWYMTRTDTIGDEKFEHYNDRKPVHVKTVSMLLSASRSDSMKVGAGEVGDALHYLNMIEPRMPEALGGVGLSLTSPIVAQVIELVKRKKRMTARQIQTLLWRDANPDELEVALRLIRGSDLPIERDATGTYVWGGK